MELGAVHLETRIYFKLVEERLCCVAAQVPNQSSESLAQLSLEKRSDSILGRAASLGSARIGPPKNDPGVNMLYSTLKRPLPKQLMIEPLREGFHIVGLFVGENGDKPISLSTASALRRAFPGVGRSLAYLGPWQVPNSVEVSASGSPQDLQAPEPSQDLQAPEPSPLLFSPEDLQMSEPSTPPDPLFGSEDLQASEPTAKSALPSFSFLDPFEKPLNQELLLSENENELLEESCSSRSEEVKAPQPLVEDPQSPKVPLSENPPLLLVKRKLPALLPKEPPAGELEPPIEVPSDRSTSGKSMPPLQLEREEVIEVPDLGRVISLQPPEPKKMNAESSSKTPIPLAPYQVIEAALEKLQLGDESQRREAEMLLLEGGELALQALFQVFPGRLSVDRYSEEPGAVPVAQHSAVLQAITLFGRQAAAGLEVLCEHLSPEIRYYAVFCFSAIRSPGSLLRIFHCLFDKDPGVRNISIFVIDRHRNGPVFDKIQELLSQALRERRGTEQRLAAEMMGRLRTTESIPDLSWGLEHPQLVEVCHQALVEIVRQDLGLDAWHWSRWFEHNRQRPRLEWVLDGLLNNQRAIRAGAFKELRSLTHQSCGYRVDAPYTERKIAVGRWKRWWEVKGKSCFARYR